MSPRQCLLSAGTSCGLNSPLDASSSCRGGRKGLGLFSFLLISYEKDYTERQGWQFINTHTRIHSVKHTITRFVYFCRSGYGWCCTSLLVFLLGKPPIADPESPLSTSRSLNTHRHSVNKEVRRLLLVKVGQIDIGYMASNGRAGTASSRHFLLYSLMRCL